MWYYVISSDGDISRLFLRGSEQNGTVVSLLEDGKRIVLPQTQQEAELIDGKLYWKDLVSIGE
jgi:hypothetical protein